MHDLPRLRRFLIHAGIALIVGLYLCGMVATGLLVLAAGGGHG